MLRLWKVVPIPWVRWCVTESATGPHRDHVHVDDRQLVLADRELFVKAFVAGRVDDQDIIAWKKKTPELSFPVALKWDLSPKDGQVGFGDWKLVVIILDHPFHALVHFRQKGQQ